MLRPVSVFIVDDHEGVRSALAARLNSSPLLRVVGDTALADDAYAKVRLLRPDVVLVETKRADRKGLEIVKRIRQESARSQVVVLTLYSSEWERLSAFHAGAARYLLKDISSDQLIEEIVSACNVSSLLVAAHH